MNINDVLLGYAAFPTYEDFEKLSPEAGEKLWDSIVENIKIYCSQHTAEEAFELAYLIKEEDLDFHFELRSALEAKPDYPPEELYTSHSPSWFIQELRQRCLLAFSFVGSPQIPVFSQLALALSEFSSEYRPEDNTFSEIFNSYAQIPMSTHELRLMLEVVATFKIPNFDSLSVIAQLGTRKYESAIEQNIFLLHTSDLSIIEQRLNTFKTLSFVRIPELPVFSELVAKVSEGGNINIGMIYKMDVASKMSLQEIRLTLEFCYAHGLGNFSIWSFLNQIDVAPEG